MARSDENKAADIAAMDDISRTATRIEAMLERWDAEDVSDEPDWDPEDIEPIALPTAPQAPRETGSSS